MGYLYAISVGEGAVDITACCGASITGLIASARPNLHAS